MGQQIWSEHLALSNRPKGSSISGLIPRTILLNADLMPNVSEATKKVYHIHARRYDRHNHGKDEYGHIYGSSTIREATKACSNHVTYASLDFIVRVKVLSGFLVTDKTSSRRIYGMKVKYNDGNSVILGQ